VEPPCGQFNPVNPALYSVLGELYQVCRVEPGTMGGLLCGAALRPVQSGQPSPLQCARGTLPGMQG
jgi:hypothetical protein